MWNQARAIIWAQWRILRNYVPRSNKVGLIFTGVLLAAWYAGFALIAVFAAFFMAKPDEVEFVRRVLPTVLLMCFLYWQLIPILMASTGSALDIRKLLVYPIPHRELFALEVLLRISTGMEMILLLIGAGIGLLVNPRVRFWGPLTLAFFVAFNLLCSAGVRDLLARLLARKRVREITTLLLVLAAALPQLMMLGGFHNQVRRLFASESSQYWPWTSAARLAQGEFSWLSVGALLAWTAVALLFGRWQFERGLVFDFADTAGKSAPRGRISSRLDWFYHWPNAVLPDPLASIVEKEMRFLSRTPRFRLVFLMGFSFGILIWFPIAFGERGTSHSMIGDNYLTFVSVYALLLLSDTLFWNVFGFDRSAAQVYFMVPLRISTVLVGKNLTAAFFVLLEIMAVALVCALLRLPVTALRILEAVSVTLVVTTFLLAIGNLSSLYNPRGVNPGRSLRTAAGARMQALLMLLFPVTLAPVALAYLARYAFESEWAFFGVLLLGIMLGALVYLFSMETAVKTAERRKEQIIAALSQGEGLIQS
jgi:ABC-2 type transport system permease protein